MGSRLMAQQFATDVRYDTFAADPPLNAVKLGLTLASTDLFGIEAEQELVSLHGVHVALFHARTDIEVPHPRRPTSRRGGVRVVLAGKIINALQTAYHVGNEG